MEKQALKIEKATKEDIKDILEMYKKRVIYNIEHDMKQWTLEEVTLEEFSKTYTIDDYYVGKCDGKVVCGMFIVDVDKLYWPSEKKGNALYLHKIVVDPDYSKRGYSDLLIEYFKEKGRREGYPKVRLDVKEHKDKLRSIYEKHGFQIVEKKQIFSEYKTVLYHFEFENSKKD